LRTIVPDPEERLKMKQKADAIVESREGGNQERVEILKDWFDDEYIAQMEIIQYPVRPALLCEIRILMFTLGTL
jgi:hypothetical protein